VNFSREQQDLFAREASAKGFSSPMAYGFYLREEWRRLADSESGELGRHARRVLDGRVGLPDDAESDKEVGS
jgi:hypothetical protein